MLYSQFFSPTKRQVAKQDSINAYLLDKAGYVAQMAAGAYSWLPLGLRTINKIERIVREEMDAIGGSEVVFTSLQPRLMWEKSGRWDDPNFRQIVYYDEAAGMTFGATHEEPMTMVVKESVQSYRDLPVILYQFQTKFRKELRPKSGLLRGREFRMKDLYSFHPDDASHHDFYEQCAQAYLSIFRRLGLDAYRVKASGGIFSQEFSDEFQVICPTGEDEVLVNRQQKTGYNKEIEEQIPAAEKNHLERTKAIEVGNIFHLGVKYAEAFDLRYLDEKGQRHPAVMGSYGIGITRLLGTLAELFNDENGLKLPAQVAPFQIYLIDLTDGRTGNRVYDELTNAGYEVLYDDRAVPAGQKLIDADLIGLPIRLVYSSKTAAQNQIELKERASGETKQVACDELIQTIAQKLS